MTKAFANTLVIVFLVSACYQKNYGPKGDIEQNGTGGFWKLSECMVRGRQVPLDQFPEKWLLETAGRLVNSDTNLASSFYVPGHNYTMFSFFDKSIALTDSFPAARWSFDLSNKNREPQWQWYRIDEDFGIVVVLDVENKDGIANRVQISNIMKSDEYKPELDTMRFIYVPTENFK